MIATGTLTRCNDRARLKFELATGLGGTTVRIRLVCLGPFLRAQMRSPGPPNAGAFFALVSRFAVTFDLSAHGLTTTCTSARDGGQRLSVPDHLTRSLRYRERAAKCRKLAAVAASDAVRAEYEMLALHYQEIADAELMLANAESAKKAN